MTRPHRYLIRMILFLAAVSGIGAILYLPLHTAFMANAPLNGLIVSVLGLGIIYNFRQVLKVYPEVAWIGAFRQNLESGFERGATMSEVRPPKLLAPMAAMVGSRQTFTLSALAMRSLLDGILSRLDESRDISRYTIGLLIFLGLL